MGQNKSWGQGWQEWGGRTESPSSPKERQAGRAAQEGAVEIMSDDTTYQILQSWTWDLNPASLEFLPIVISL